jgi:hypothetical protein
MLLKHRGAWSGASIVVCNLLNHQESWLQGHGVVERWSANRNCESESTWNLSGPVAVEPQSRFVCKLQYAVSVKAPTK